MRVWVGLGVLQVAVGAAYWGRQLIDDVGNWPKSLQQRRSEICPKYRAIMRASDLLPAEAVVLLENPSAEDEHFCLYYLYPRRVLTAWKPGVTHRLRLSGPAPSVVAVQGTGPGR